MTEPDAPCDLKVLEQISLKVVEASPDAKIVIDSNGRVVIFNTQAEFMFGYDRSEVIGKTIEVLLPDDKKATHIAHRQGYFDEPKTREMGQGMRLEGQHRDGTRFIIQIKLAPIVVAGAGVHALAVVRRVKQ